MHNRKNPSNPKSECLKLPVFRWSKFFLSIAKVLVDYVGFSGDEDADWVYAEQGHERQDTTTRTQIRAEGVSMNHTHS